jgi:peptidyl-prolyl cis-trans isomerase C
MLSVKQSSGALFAFLILVFVFPLVLFGQPPAPPAPVAPVASANQDPSDVLATIGDLTLTRELFHKELKNLGQRPVSENPAGDGKQFLKELIELLLLEKEANTPLSPDEAKKVKEDGRRSTLILLSQALLRDLIEEAGKNAPKPPEPKPEQSFHVHQITFPSLAEAQKAKGELTAGKSFADLARQSSQDGFKERGGDRGFLTSRDVSPVIWSALEKLPANTVSEPLEESPTSVLLLKYSDKQVTPGTTPEGADPRREFQQAAFEKIMTDMCASMSVQTNPAALAVLGKPEHTQAERDMPVLTIGTETVKLGELLDDMKQIPEFIRQQLLTGPGMQDFIKQFTFREAIRVHSDRNFEALIQKYPHAQIRAERETRIRHYLSQKLKDVSVTDDEIMAFYTKNLARFSQPAMRKAHHILVETEEKAKALLERINKGESLEELAKTESKCPSGKNGGDLGSFSRGQMVPEFDAALDGAEVGKVVGPVKTTFGFHLIRLDDRREAANRPLEEVREDIREQLLPEKHRSAFEQLMAGLRQKYPVKEFPEKL